MCIRDRNYRSERYDRYGLSRYLSHLRVAFDLVVPLMLEKGYATAEDLEGLMHLPELFNRTRKTIASKTLENAPVPPVSSADESETFRCIMEDESEEWFCYRGHNELEISPLRLLNKHKIETLRDFPVPCSLVKEARVLFSEYITTTVNEPESTLPGGHPRKNHFTNYGGLARFYERACHYLGILFKIKRVRCRNVMHLFQRIMWLFGTYDLLSIPEMWSFADSTSQIFGTCVFKCDDEDYRLELCADSDVVWNPYEYYEVVYAPPLQERINQLKLPQVPPPQLSFKNGMYVRIKNNDGENGDERKLYIVPKGITQVRWVNKTVWSTNGGSCPVIMKNP